MLLRILYEEIGDGREDNVDITVPVSLPAQEWLAIGI
jgi:hypothetical protein